MAQFTRLAAAIAAASLAGAVHAGDVEVNFSGEVDFAFEYHNYDEGANGDSSSSVYLDTAELGVQATDGTTTAGLVLEFGGSGNASGNDDDSVDIDNAFLEHKLNDNYSLFAEYDDTVIGLQGESMMWNDSFHKDTIYDFADTMAGVKIKGGPISSTLYVSQGRSGDDDLQEFGTSVDYSADMFTAHFGYVSDAIANVGSPIGAFSFGGTATINNIVLIGEYVMLTDDVSNDDPTYLQLEANYEMNGYTLGAAYMSNDDAEALETNESRIALSVAKDITDMLWVQAELDFDKAYADNDDTSLWLVAGASF